MTANDATMKVIIWIHIFLLKTPFRGFSIQYLIIQLIKV